MVFIIGIGQLAEIIKYQIGHIGKKLDPIAGAKGMQQSIVGTGVNHIVDKYRCGVHDISEHLAAVAAAARVFASDKIDNVFRICTQFSDLCGGQITE